MKTVTANAQAQLDQRFGTEPIVMVEISWAEGSTSLYADKDVDGAAGKILQISEIETVLTPENIQSASVSLTLDDTDGSIKLGADTIDVHKKDCDIYLYFGDLSDQADRIKLFTGQVSTPFKWAENARQVQFDVVSEIENYEVGFSPEEGQLDFVHEDNVGKPWPLAFGHVRHIPAQKVSLQKTATLLERICRVDPLLYYKLQEIAQAYQLEAVHFTLWNLIRIGTHQMVPPVWWTLREYVKVIIWEDQILNRIFMQHDYVQFLRNLAREFPVNMLIRQTLGFAVDDLDTLGLISSLIQSRKRWLEEIIKLTCFAYDMEKKAIQEMLKAVTRMKELFAQYRETQQEICLQLQCVKECVLVQDADVFPDNTDVDILIKKVKFRVKFKHSDNQMCHVAGPLEMYNCPPIQTWKPDDAPCHQITEMDGLDLVWLAQDPPPNMDGCYMLVKKRGGQEGVRHILKIRKQEGQKVYFDLVEWDQGNNSGSPRGQDLDSIINKTVEPPGGWALGPFGNMIPRGLFTGDLDPNVWNRPEAALLLQILRMIPGGVNREELQNLAKLIYMLPFDQLSTLVILIPGPRQIYTIIGPDIEKIESVCGLIQTDWLERYTIPYEEIPESLFWEAEPGTPIREEGPACDIFIANILPSTIKAVSAYRTNRDGLRYLAPVPSSYYIKNESANLGTIDVTSLTFPIPIHEIAGEGWEKEIYVTLNSSVGPNVVDVIQHLVETYTNKTANAASFATASSKLANYPVHFCLFDRPDALAEIARIAWEARLGVTIVNDEFFLKYLSEEPTADRTITETDVEDSALTLRYSRTEELMTRIVAEFQKDYLPLEGNDRHPRVVLRHNVKKYGLHHRDEKFHTLVHRETVEKSATFWLIRYANTWKKLDLKVLLKHIDVDALDTVDVNLATAWQDHVTEDANLLTVCESAVFDPNDLSIKWVLHLPVKTGSMIPYPYFWPAMETPTEWPPDDEIGEGFAGGFGPGSGVTGTISDCPEPEEED